MKFANGYGSITKLAGHRRKPYWVRSAEVKYKDGDKVKSKRTTIGYFATQKEAVKALADYNENPYALVSLTFEKLWEISKGTKKVCDKRLKDLNGVFNNHLGSLKEQYIKDVRTVDLQKLFDDCERGSTTKDNMLAVLNCIYNYACANDYIGRNYAQYIVYDNDHTQKQRILFSDLEVEKLWNNRGKWQYDFLLILLYTGCRFSEIANNKIENLDLINNTILIPEDNAKNNVSIRTIPIHKKILPIIKAHAGKNYLFETEDGEKVVYSNFYYNYLPEINDLLGVKHSFHDTRHTFTTRLRHLKVDLVYVNALTGHTQKSITDSVYNHIDIEDLREEINKLYYRV